jgi:hypothetical protein
MFSVLQPGLYLFCDVQIIQRVYEALQLSLSRGSGVGTVGGKK